MHELSQSATLNALPEQQSRTKPQVDVSANRLGREVRDIADLLSAAVCRGESEVAARYWRELGDLIGVRGAVA